MSWRKTKIMGVSLSGVTDSTASIVPKFCTTVNLQCTLKVYQKRVKWWWRITVGRWMIVFPQTRGHWNFALWIDWRRFTATHVYHYPPIPMLPGSQKIGQKIGWLCLSATVTSQLFECSNPSQIFFLSHLPVMSVGFYLSLKILFHTFHSRLSAFRRYRSPLFVSARSISLGRRDE